MKIGFFSYSTRRNFSTVLVLLICFFYWFLGYHLERNDFPQLLILYSVIWLFTWKLLQLRRNDMIFLIGAGLLFRLVLLWATPNLSQDFYRFLWDGHLLVRGQNPYLLTPEQWVQLGDIPIPNWKTLLSKMGSLSAGNPTNYPPLNQLFFALGAWLGGKSIFTSVIVLRLLVIFADIAILWFGQKLLKLLGLPPRRIFWYFLNPFILVELTGNLHFEGVMIFFLAVALYFLHRNKLVASALFMGCSVSLKLIPLIFLPFVFTYLGFRKGSRYAGIVLLFSLLLFAPFFSSQFLKNYTASLGLWFQNFEFNASIWYLIRWIGFEFRGYNIIEFAGPVLGLIVTIILSILALIKRPANTRTLIPSMLLAISLYLFFSTTIHPWYLATPLFLCLFTHYQFPLAWSFTIILSYSAYSRIPYQEVPWLLFTEYFVVFTFLYRDFRKQRKTCYSYISRR